MRSNIKYTQRTSTEKQLAHLHGRIIVIDGIIGVGKSVLGRSIECYLNNHNITAKFFPEYFNKKLLDYYLSNIREYAFMFQAIMANSRIELYRRALEYAKIGGVSIIDRSILGDTAFAKMQLDKGFISKEQYEIYWSILDQASDLYAPDYTIYLDCSIETCIRRINRRNIDSEVQTYDIDYHNALTTAYNDVYKAHPDLVVYKLDYNTDDARLSNGMLSDLYIVNILNEIVKPNSY